MQLFWLHREDILKEPRTEDLVDERIDRIVESAAKDTTEEGSGREYNDGSYDKIGESGIYIGSRTAGRPPGCWERFDAIVNVTMDEYKDISARNDKHYLWCPVAEGKKDKTELQRWLPSVLAFVGIHGVGGGGRVLIHCNQGKDRSVALAIACLAVFGDIRDKGEEEGRYTSASLEEKLFGEVEEEEVRLGDEN